MAKLNMTEDELNLSLSEIIKAVIELKADKARLRDALLDLACDGNWSENGLDELVWVGSEELSAQDFAKEALKVTE